MTGRQRRVTPRSSATRRSRTWPSSGVGVAKKHGIPQSCVSKWAKVAGVRAQGNAARPAETTTPEPQHAPGDQADGALGRAEAERGGEGAEPDVGVGAERRRGEGQGDHYGTKAAEPPSRRTLKSRVAKLYTPSQKAVILEDAKKDGITAAAKKHGVSRFAIYAWHRKVAKAATGDGPSPTHGSCAEGDRGATRPGDPRRVAPPPRARAEPDPEPAPPQEHQGQRQHRPPRDGGRWVPAAEGRA